MNSIKRFAEFVNENLNEAVTKIKVYDDSAGPDEEGFKLLNKLRPNDKIQFIAGDIDPDDLDIETGVIKAKDANKLFDSPFNEKFTFADAVETAGDDVKKNEKGIAAALKALKARKADDIMIMTDTTEDDGLFDAIKGMKTLPIDSTIYDKAYVGKYKGKDVVVFGDGEDMFAYTK